MKVLVRQADAALYLTSNGQWGPKNSAREFPDLQSAGREAFWFEDADVVLSYDEPPCELVLNPAYCFQPDVPSRPRL
jgi:hypothetical protein